MISEYWLTQKWSQSSHAFVCNSLFRQEHVFFFAPFWYFSWNSIASSHKRRKTYFSHFCPLKHQYAHWFKDASFSLIIMLTTKGSALFLRGWLQEILIQNLLKLVKVRHESNQTDSQLLQRSTPSQKIKKNSTFITFNWTSHFEMIEGGGEGVLSNCCLGEHQLQKHADNMKCIRDSLWRCHSSRLKVSHYVDKSRNFQIPLFNIVPSTGRKVLFPSTITGKLWGRFLVLYQLINLAPILITLSSN